jgi:DNA-binding NtrC family response regulator
MTEENHGRIITVDDDPLVTATLGFLLQLESEFSHVAFNDPNEALDYLKQNEVDVIVSDFVMPQMDGLTFLGRAREVQPEPSRILLTGYADKESAIRAINTIGLYHYVEKPWDNERLLLVMRNAAERTRLLRMLGDHSQSLDAMRERIWRTLL